SSQAGNPLNRQKLPDTPFRTTNEMLDCFKFLGEDVANEIVIADTQKIAEQIEDISAVKEELYTPNIEGADQEIRDLSYNRARQIYGDVLPDILEERWKKNYQVLSITDLRLFI